MARADRRTTATLLRLGSELRTARLAAGLTLAQTARVVGISVAEASRVERGESPWLDVATLARLAAVVGLDLWIRAYPGNEPLRDAAHVRLCEAFLALVGKPLVVRTEVGIGSRGDLRAWDVTLAEPGHRRCGVELETRIVDAQAQHRRIDQKLADSDVDLVLVVVADTRANRIAVRAAASYLGSSYAIADPAATEALRVGRLPPRPALIFVPVTRRTRSNSRPAGASDATVSTSGTFSRAPGLQTSNSRPTRQRDE